MGLRKFTTCQYTIIILFCHLVSDTVSKKLVTVSSDPTANLYLKSLRFTHKPGVRNRSYCPNSRTFLIGARIRSITLLNDTAQSITAIELICSDRIRAKLNPSFFHTKNPLIIEKDVGVWGDIEECPNGLFVTGLTFHLQPQPVSTSNMDYDYDLPSTPGRSHFISGLSLHCTYKHHTNVSEPNVTDTATPSSVTLGHSSDLSVGIACQSQTVISGAEIFEEPAVAKHKERLTQVKLALKCSHLVNPAKYCTPDLEWERITDVICHPSVDRTNITPTEVNLPTSTNNATDTTTESPRNVTGATTCDAHYAVGTTMNFKIRNLDSITSAYYPVGLDNDRKLGEIILNRLKSHTFRYDWKQRYNLKTDDYNVATTSAEMYSTLKNTTHSFSTEIPLALSQVVGYCSIYKIYFPILKEWLD